MGRKHDTPVGSRLFPQPLKRQINGIDKQTGFFPVDRIIFIINLLFSKNFRAIFYLNETAVHKAVKFHRLIKLRKQTDCVDFL